MDRRAFARRIAPVIEPVVGGGRLRERTLVSLLKAHYQSRLRREWSDPERAPHFFDHRISSFAFATGEGSPFVFFRGYFAAELIRPGDRLLDIGCGDGFFARRFFGPRCSAVDAIDVDPRAIAHASRHNPAPNVAYRTLDAFADPFPHEEYDVVVWDGGLGHVSAEMTGRILPKIRRSLAPEGVFLGSESLGLEGHDHLQFFDSLDELSALLFEHFAHVEVRQLEYEVPGVRRTEAFWRCADDRRRLDDARWRSSTGQPSR